LGIDWRGKDSICSWIGDLIAAKTNANDNDGMETRALAA
jgi:hypothetical protein